MNVNFATLANKNKDALDQNRNAAIHSQQLLDDEKIARYNIAIDALQPILHTCGFKAVLHTDKSHFPCPAIHIESEQRGRILGTSISDYLSEIAFSKDKQHWYFGSCNQHRHTTPDIDGLKLNIAQRLAAFCDVPATFSEHDDIAFRTLYQLSNKRIEDTKERIMNTKRERLVKINKLDVIMQEIQPTLSAAGMRVTFNKAAEPSIFISTGAGDYIKIGACIPHDMYHFTKGVSHITEKLEKDNLLVALASKLAPYL